MGGRIGKREIEHESEKQDNGKSNARKRKQG